ncbi:MAG: tRNA (adenosine(37)-N6)-threonylcarbamoyltransferase complex dimerization subunit type 1 TsaB [Nitrospinota bacterium]
MIVLGIDTSTLLGSVAVVDNGRLVYEDIDNTKTSYSKRLLLMIDNVLKRTVINMDRIDGYALAIGPGSFTGLRIGLSICKGFFAATGKPIIGVDTLYALANTLTYSSNIICPILNAKKGEVYSALYRYKDNHLNKLTDDMAINPERLCSMINEPAIFVGDGIDVYRELLSERLGNAAIFTPKTKGYSNAASIAEIGLRKLERGDVPNAMTLQPKYIRRSEAEIKWNKK